MVLRDLQILCVPQEAHRGNRPLRVIMGMTLSSIPIFELEQSHTHSLTKLKMTKAYSLDTEGSRKGDRAAPRLQRARQMYKLQISSAILGCGL